MEAEREKMKALVLGDPGGHFSGSGDDFSAGEGLSFGNPDATRAEGGPRGRDEARFVEWR